MIIVVADDFTGAAELAGIGLMHGLSVELDLDYAEPSGADLVVIATDTRSKDLDEAIAELTGLSKKILDYKPDWVFKKIDSVLRGHILEETSAMVKAMNMNGAIMVPANPALGRVIIDGKYYVKGEPISSTSFSEDPEFRISTSSVEGLLSRNGSTPPFEVVKPEHFTDEGNIIVGEASTITDLGFWAKKAKSGWLPVGAAGFFQAILDEHGLPVVNGNSRAELHSEINSLYLCGSTFQGSRDQVTMANEAGPHVCYMPEKLFNREKGFERALIEWADKVANTISQHGKAIVAVEHPVISEQAVSNWIKYNFAVLVKETFERTTINELIIEGGSTASAVLCNMGLTRLTPLYQFQQGVIRMKVENIPGLNLTLKPGSYTWPKTVWNF